LKCGVSCGFTPQDRPDFKILHVRVFRRWLVAKVRESDLFDQVMRAAEAEAEKSVAVS
jgi:hypothetical protein